MLFLLYCNFQKVFAAVGSVFDVEGTVENEANTIHRRCTFESSDAVYIFGIAEGITRRMYHTFNCWAQYMGDITWS